MALYSKVYLRNKKESNISAPLRFSFLRSIFVDKMSVKHVAFAWPRRPSSGRYTTPQQKWLPGGPGAPTNRPSSPKPQGPLSSATGRIWTNRRRNRLISGGRTKQHSRGGTKVRREIAPTAQSSKMALRARIGFKLLVLSAGAISMLPTELKRELYRFLYCISILNPLYLFVFL